MGRELWPPHPGAGERSPQSHTPSLCVLCTGRSALLPTELGSATMPQAPPTEEPAGLQTAGAHSHSPPDVEISLLRHPKVGPRELNPVHRLVPRGCECWPVQGTRRLFWLWSGPCCGCCDCCVWNGE